MKIGLESLFEHHVDLLRGQRIGLIVHPASINQQYEHAADLFHRSKEFQLTTLFGPQHGSIIAQPWSCSREKHDLN